MRGINKQKFLTELGRLLTFMYEEDRTRALAMYRSVFDETDDETGVLQLLVSPTRQAVNLARSYDARERKLQVQAQSRGEAPTEEEPAFVHLIEQLRAQAATLGAPVSKVSADQFSLFEDAKNETALFDEVEAQDAPVFTDFSTPDYPAPAVDVPPAENNVPFGEGSASVDAIDAFLTDVPVPDELPDLDEFVPVAAPEEETAAQFAPSVSPAPPVPQEERTGSMPGARPAPVPPPLLDSERTQDAIAYTPMQSYTPADPVPAPESPAAPRAEAPRSEIRAGARPIFTVSKPRVGLLILFLLLAVPITLVCILVLLIPALLALGVAALAGWLGFTGILATFGSFTVFADILLVFGCTLIVLALALLFLWICIWLLGGVIPALIRGVCALAHRWCYKEVPVK